MIYGILYKNHPEDNPYNTYQQQITSNLYISGSTNPWDGYLINENNSQKETEYLIFYSEGKEYRILPWNDVVYDESSYKNVTTNYVYVEKTPRDYEYRHDKYYLFNYSLLQFYIECNNGPQRILGIGPIGAIGRSYGESELKETVIETFLGGFTIENNLSSGCVDIIDEELVIGLDLFGAYGGLTSEYCGDNSIGNYWEISSEFGASFSDVNFTGVGCNCRFVVRIDDFIFKPPYGYIWDNYPKKTIYDGI